MATLPASEETNIAVFGLGYVGCVTAACLAHLGHRVTGVDKDSHKTSKIQNREAPFYEPGLEEVIRQTVSQGRLSATTSIEEGLRDADLVLICVGTPSEPNGNLSLAQMRRVCGQIADEVRERTQPLVVAIRSTMFPGACEEMAGTYFGDIRHVTVACNPEFLREGAAVNDFLEPSLVVVGAFDDTAARKVAGLYASLGVTPSIVSVRTAELIKYACNAFHAVKITFANEVGTLASHMGMDGGEVMKVLCRDTRLNISPAYLKPGFAFGGSCLPKDLRALVFRASRLDLRLPLLESILPSNQSHLERTIQAVLALPARRLGIFGLAFKEGTDDLRESPVVALVEQLIGKGRDVRIFDPHIQLDQIYGSNQNFILKSVPHIGRLMVQGPEKLCEWAECLIVTQKPPVDHAELLRDCNRPIFDLTLIEEQKGRSPVQE